MNIAIIGAGNIGGTLAGKLVKLGHKVFIANSRGPASLADFAATTGAVPVTVEEAANNGNVVIISIPFKSVPELPKDLFKNVPAHVAIVDTGNYYPTIRDGIIQEVEDGLQDSEWVQQQIGKKVVKAFNSIAANSLINGGRPRGDKDRFALSIAGDDEQAKAVVMQLIDELGFDPYDQGQLKHSWRQQGGTAVYCTDLKLADMIAAIDAQGTELTPEIHKRDAIARDERVAAYLRSLEENQ